MEDFLALGLTQPVVDAIEELGFKTPTPIQAQAIPRLISDNEDFIGLAQTGTGKTAAFGLPLIVRVDISNKTTQALILAPTRELCVQICKELNLFAKKLPKIRILPVYGGTDISRQIREVKRGVHILVATPGRLRDLMRRKAVDIRNIQYVVLDEADEMLNMGFKEEIDEILEDTPDTKKTWLFSATMPQEVRRISRNYMDKPFELSIGQKNTSNKDIEHQFVPVMPSAKYEALKRFLDFDNNTFGLVFCRTRMNTRKLADQLNQDGYNADAIHGDLSQGQRDRVMGLFRSRRIKVLVATDVAARGIDVDDISHVFHYNIPEDLNFYTHRSGRTGRAGKKGVSLVLGHPKDKSIIRRLERILKVEFKNVKIPSGKVIFERKLQAFFQEINNIPVSENIKDLSPEILNEFEDLSKEELIEKLASHYIKHKLGSTRMRDDLNLKERDHVLRGRGQRLFINIGLMDVAGKSGFLAFVCKRADIPGSAIGKIDIREKHTFFDVDPGKARIVIKELNGLTHDGRAIRVNAGMPNNGRKETRRKKFRRHR